MANPYIKEMVRLLGECQAIHTRLKLSRDRMYNMVAEDMASSVKKLEEVKNELLRLQRAMEV